MEDQRLRAHLESDLRSRTYRLHRRNRHCYLRPQHNLCRQRGGTAPSRSLCRRRHLSLERCRHDLDTSRPARWPADSGIAVDPTNPIGSLLLCSAILTARIRNEASFARPTVARVGRRFFIRTKALAAPMLWSIPSDPYIVYARLWRQRAGTMGGQEQLCNDRRWAIQVN